MSTKIEERLEALEGAVKALSGAVADNSKVKVKFKVKKSDTGIEIAGGPTTIDKVGTVIGTIPMPDPNNRSVMMISAIVVDENGKAGFVGPIESLEFIV